MAGNDGARSEKHETGPFRQKHREQKMRSNLVSFVYFVIASLPRYSRSVLTAMTQRPELPIPKRRIPALLLLAFYPDPTPVLLRSYSNPTRILPESCFKRYPRHAPKLPILTSVAMIARSCPVRVYDVESATRHRRKSIEAVHNNGVCQHARKKSTPTRQPDPSPCIRFGLPWPPRPRNCQLASAKAGASTCEKAGLYVNYMYQPSTNCTTAE